MSRDEVSSWGPQVLSDGRVEFVLWAPAAHRVSLSVQGLSTLLPMTRDPEGWHQLVTDQAAPGTLYEFVLPNGSSVPDPASRFQPHDVTGPSEVIDPASYVWKQSDWRGRPWHEAVIYELHVGTFTAEGTFRAVIEKLQYLRDLGITALEIMPIGDFPGTRNWGYDGVFWYAPESSYGRPEDFKALIDAAHGCGLMVLLDVIYNHFGPEGNFLSTYAPDFFTERHQTPWGAGINYDGDNSAAVRAFATDNALYWLQEFRLDGLRLDAVHAIKDDSSKHLLRELAERVRSTITDRPIHLLLENEENDTRLLERDSNGAPRVFTAQWNDDIHHVLHTAATAEDSGYYADYIGDTDKLGRAVGEGFAFQGEIMTCRGTQRGQPSGHLPPDAFVSFIQNHDQIGNRAFGDRLSQGASNQALKAIAATYLLAPQIPMLFMGEEWASRQPFPFFCDFHGELAQAVRDGRRAEFAKFPQFQDPNQRDQIPDPQSPGTFASAKLNWDELDDSPHREWHLWYQKLIKTRRSHVVPWLAKVGIQGGHYTRLAPSAIHVSWSMPDGEELNLIANLSNDVVSAPQALPGSTEIVWVEGATSLSGECPAWTVCWWIRRSGS
jgi:maltooligosyltrehalose trehalohydrolase